MRKNDKSMRAEELFDGIGRIDRHWILMADDHDEIERAIREYEKEEQQRHFVLYELKKLAGVRYLWVFLVIFLLLNSAIAWMVAGQSTAADEPADMIEQFMMDYFADPAAYDAHYAAMEAFEREQDALFLEAMLAHRQDFEPQTMPDIYSTDGDFSDRELFGALHSAIGRAEGYSDTIEGVLDSARANLREFEAMGIAENSFSYRYQLRVIELYEQAKENVRIGVEHTRGWEEYFSYDVINIFLLLMLIMLGTVIFGQERQSGFLPILRASRHGRGRTAAAKLLAVMLVSSSFVLLFTLSTFAVFGLRLGYSSSQNALQVLSSFTLSPYLVTVGEYFVMTLGVRLLVAVTFAAAIMALSALARSEIMAYLYGLGFLGVNFICSLLPADVGAVKYLNAFSVAAAKPLFTRYRALGVFGHVVGYVPLMAVLCVILCAVFGIFAAQRHISGAIRRDLYANMHVKALWTMRSRLRTLLERLADRQTRRARRYSMSLTAAEIFKLLISSRFLAVVLVILCFKVVYAGQVFENRESYGDRVYQEYMTVLEGQINEEKLAYLQEERAEINATLSLKERMEADYMAERIGFEEYRAYLSDYNDAYVRDELLKPVEERAAYLSLRLEETGDCGWFFYDTGWMRLFDNGADLFLYAAVLLLLTGIFASEYVSRSSSGGFAQILRATQKGRQHTFVAKLFAASTVTIALALLTTAVDLAAVFARFAMPALQAPLWSMPAFAEVGGGMTVGQYLALFVILRTLGAWLLAMLVCALSELLCRYIPVLGSSVMLTLLPALCAAFGLAAAEKLNYLNLLAGTPLWLMSAQSTLFGSDFTLLTLWIAVFATAVAALTVSAKRMFVQ
ncbi:MAG: hypothetical protein J6W14_08550 [Clostridia bacterium]|nr:hypothetical protein [Clostridia bacterium]